MDHFILVPDQALRTSCPPTSEGVGTEDLQVPQGTKLEGDIRVAVGVMVMITIGGTGTMGEMEVGEGGGGGGGSVVVITEVGTTVRHTGTWIVTIGDRCLLDDICGVDEADRRALHQEVPGMGISHGETNVPEVPPVWTHANHHHLHNRPP